MNYAWKAVLQAEKHGMDRDSLRFVEASTPSPYIEVSVVDLNQESPEEERVEVNPLYRLGDVFGKLFDRNIEGYEQLREVFFDVCMHQIVRLDLREGLSKEDFYCSLIIQDIEEGRYGEQAREMFLPMQETVHWFYGHHFGIIGVDETMLVDEAVIF